MDVAAWHWMGRLELGSPAFNPLKLASSSSLDSIPSISPSSPSSSYSLFPASIGIRNSVGSPFKRCLKQSFLFEPCLLLLRLLIFLLLLVHKKDLLANTLFLMFSLYELLDKMMDFGYPQYTEARILSEFIKTDAYRMGKL